MSVNNAKIRGTCALNVLLLDWPAITCRFLDGALSFRSEMLAGVSDGDFANFK